MNIKFADFSDARLTNAEKKCPSFKLWVVTLRAVMQLSSDVEQGL